MAILMHHASGDVTKWCTAFADNSSFADVLGVDVGPRCAGHYMPIVTLKSHPTADLVLSVGEDRDEVEALVWRVQRDCGVSHTERVLQDPTIFKSNDREPGFPAQFCWVPTTESTTLVKSSASGIRVIGLPRTSKDGRQELSTMAEVSSTDRQYLKWRGLWCQVGAQLSDVDTSYWVYGLHDDGAALSVWRIVLTYAGSRKLHPDLKLDASATLILDAHNLSAIPPLGRGGWAHRDQDGVQLAFMHCHNSSSDARLNAHGEPRTAYLGLVVPGTGLHLFTCCSTDGSPGTAAEAKVEDVDCGDFSDGLGDDARLVAVGPSGLVAVAGGNESRTRTVRVLGFHLTGVGIREVTQLNLGEAVHSIGWGASSAWQDVLYVLTSENLRVYAPNIPAGVASGNMYTELSCTSVADISLPTSLVCHTGSGLALVSSGKALHVQSIWSVKDDDADSEAEGAGATDIDMEIVAGQTAVTVDQLLLEKRRNLPQYHSAQLIDFFLCGQSHRVDLVIQTMAAAFRQYEADTALGTAPEQVPLPWVGLDQLWRASGEQTQAKAAETTEQGYDALFDTSVTHGGSDSTAKDAAYVCEQLGSMQLPGLSRRDQVAALAVLESATEIELNRMSLDECGIRFFVPLLQTTCLQRSSQNRGRSPALHPSAYVWAMHSDAQERLLELCPGIGQKPGFLWEDLRAVGGGFWIGNHKTLKEYAEKVAKNTFNVTKQPLDAALWYLAMGKKSVLWGLFKSVGDQRMSGFFGNDFNEERWITAAQNNGFKLLSLQRFHHAIAFFLLGGALEEATHICTKNLKDIQLAIVLARLYSNGEPNAVLDGLLAQQGEEEEDPFVRHMALWIKKDYSASFASLLNYGAGAEDGATERDTLITHAPTVLNLCRVLQNNTSVKSHCKKHPAREQLLTDVPVRLFFRAFESYIRRGMPLLALDTLVSYTEAEAEAATSGTQDGNSRATKAGTTITALKPMAAVDVDSGMIDFGSFGGFADEFSQFDAPADASLADAKKAAEDAVAAAALEAEVLQPTWKIGQNIITLWKWQCCINIIAQGVVQGIQGLSWAGFCAAFDGQVARAAQICGQSKAAAEDGIRKACITTARGLDMPHLELMLQAQSDPPAVLVILDRLSTELLNMLRRFVSAYSQEKAAPQPTRPADFRRVHQLVEQLSGCLHQVTHNLMQGERSLCPSACNLAEYICIVYSALFVVAWKQKDAAALLVLFTNAPDVSLWDHLCPGSSTANEAETLMRAGGNPDAVDADAGSRSLLSFMHRKVDDKKYTDVDAAANWNNDLTEVIVVTHKPGSPDQKSEHFRWYLTDFVAAKYSIGLLREVVHSTVSVKLNDLDKVSHKLYRVLEAMEEFTAVAQLKLSALPTPLSAEPASGVSASGTAPGAVGAAHKAHGLFKMRKLLDVSQNIFQPLGARRLWSYLVQQEHLHKSFEFHMFERQPKFAASIRVGDWASIYNAGTEVYSMCDVSRHDSELVIGTSKGIVELHAHDTNVLRSLHAGTPPPFLGRRGSASSPSFDIPASRSASPVQFGAGVESPAADGSTEVENQMVPGLTRAIPGGVRALAKHPTMPCYVSGSSHGLVQLWHFNQQHPLSTFRTDSTNKLNALRFSDYGNKFGAVNSGGDLMLWRFLSGDDSDDPFLSIKVNTKRTDDFRFLCSTSLIATGGLNADGCNVNLWDTLLISTDRFSMAHPIRSFDINDGGTRALGYSPASQRLICGSHKGEISVVDFRQQAVIKTWSAHEGSVNTLIVNEEHDTILSASSSGDVKLWSLNSLRQIANYDGLHARSTFFKSGVVDMVLQNDSVLTCGIDGFIKASMPW